MVLASSLIMQAWALMINNIGRRRYPVYWFHPTHTLVKLDVAPDDEEKGLQTLQDNPKRAAEDGGRNQEVMLEQRLQGEGSAGEDDGVGDGSRDNRAVPVFGSLGLRT